MKLKLTKFLIVIVFSIGAYTNSYAQRGGINWTKEGNAYYQNVGGEIVTITLPKSERKTIISSALLTPANSSTPIPVRSFQLSDDGTKALIYTNTKRV